MKKHLTLLQGVTQMHFHTVPSELSMITVTPERKAISEYLARITYQEFPEFIRDILKAQGHTDVQITDGTGDEKQDLLSTTPTGERQLTQCKHTIHPEEHYSGDDLDLLFGACNRKNCTRGLLCTNGELTPQAKRYITDSEYSRLATQQGTARIELDYWNGIRIWDLIATNNAILNKWFGGMGQTHGLRSFSFELVIQRMPDGKVDAIRSGDVVSALGALVEQTTAGVNCVKLGEHISFTIEDWFANDLNLGVNFVGTPTEHRLINIPLAALKLHISVADAIGQYDAAGFRDQVVEFIGSRALPKVGKDEWWHIIATPCQAFLFLQDIVQPKVITITDAASFVRVGDASVTSEVGWVSLSGDDYKRLTDDGDDDLHWQHLPSDTTIKVYVSQRPHPVAAYEHYVRQSALAQKVGAYEFRAIAHFDPNELDRVRRLITDPRWVIMSSDRDELFWAFPPGTEPEKIAEIDEKLSQEGLKVLRVADEDRAKLVEWIDVTPADTEWLLNDSESNLVVPIALGKRMFWLRREIELQRPEKINTWMELVTFKAQYEVQHGYDFMRGKTQGHLSGSEIQPLLFDVLTMRGDRMLDFVFSKGKLNINLRIREELLDATDALIPGYIAELQRLTNEILMVVGKEVSHGEPVPVGA
jgi:Restriction endonuclease